MDNSSSAAPSLEFPPPEPDSLPAQPEAVMIPQISSDPMPSVAPTPFLLLPEYEIEEDPIPPRAIRSAIRRVTLLPIEVMLRALRDATVRAFARRDPRQWPAGLNQRGGE